jgi:hypothetical protein
VAEERRAVDAKLERVRAALAERYEAGFKPLLAEAEARHAEELRRIVELQVRGGDPEGGSGGQYYQGGAMVKPAGWVGARIPNTTCHRLPSHPPRSASWRRRRQS